MKKTARKVLLMACSALLLVCLTVGATVAYLTSTTDVVENTFTVGNVQITLDETEVDVYGKAVTPAAKTIENTYKLIPGHTYTKDPTIHVAKGSEECYLFVKVEDGIVDIQDATTIADQMAANNWEATAQKNVFVLKNTVNALEATDDIDVPVFANFKIKGDAAVDECAGKTITIVACAVQADGLTKETALAQVSWTK